MNILSAIEYVFKRILSIFDFERVLPEFTVNDKVKINEAANKLIDNRQIKELIVKLECGQNVYVSIC